MQYVAYDFWSKTFIVQVRSLQQCLSDCNTEFLQHQLKL